MKDKEKILKAFEFLEKGKNKIDNKRFQESCKILNKYILDAYEENVITETEANTFSERLTDLMEDTRKTVIKTEKYKEIPNIKICPKCGTENKVNAKFCYECGYTFAKTEILEEDAEGMGSYQMLLIILSGISGLCIGYLLFGKFLGFYIPIKELISGLEIMGIKLVDFWGIIVKIVFTGILSTIFSMIIVLQFKKKSDLVRLTSIGGIATIFLIAMVFMASANVFTKEPEWTFTPQTKNVEKQTGTIGSKLMVTNITNDKNTFYITIKNATGYELVNDLIGGSFTADDLDVDEDNYQADVMVTIKDSTGSPVVNGIMVKAYGSSTASFTNGTIDNDDGGQIEVIVATAQMNPGETYTIIITAAGTTSTEKYTAI